MLRYSLHGGAFLRKISSVNLCVTYFCLEEDTDTCMYDVQIMHELSRSTNTCAQLLKLSMVLKMNSHYSKLDCLNH